MGGETIRVVIIEDHLVVGEALAYALGHEADIEVVGIAGSVAEGLSAVTAHRPDVLLMDVALPDGDGTTATASVRELSPETAVLILTATGGDDLAPRAIEAGASGLLFKTSRLNGIVEAVRRVHRGCVLFDAAEVSAAASHRPSPDERLGSDLTTREREILTWLVRGASTQSIAQELFLSEHTVRNHVRSILAKLGVHSRLEAVAVATREGLVDGSGEQGRG